MSVRLLYSRLIVSGCERYMSTRNRSKPNEIHTSVREDRNEGWVWIRDSELRELLENQRRTVRIKAGDKKIFCEALYADGYFLDQFNDQMAKANRVQANKKDCIVFANAWYRQRLGLKPGLGDRRNLDITVSGYSSRWQLAACRAAVRYAFGLPAHALWRKGGRLRLRREA